MGARTSNCRKRQPQSPGAKQIVTSKTVHALGQHTRHHHQTAARHEKRLSVLMFGTIDELHGQRKVRLVLGPHTAAGPSLYSGETQGTLRSDNSAELCPQQILETGFAKELYHIGHAKYEQSSEKEGSHQAASNKTKDDKQFTSPLSTLRQKKHAKSPKRTKRTKPRHDAIFAVDMEGAQVLPHTQRLRCLLLHQKVHLDHRQTRNLRHATMNLAREQGMGMMLAACAKRKQPREFLWSLPCAQHLLLLFISADGIGARTLGPSLHLLLHGGASHNRLTHEHSLAGSQFRGSWKAVSSRRRYAKHGLVTKEVAEVRVPVLKRSIPRTFLLVNFGALFAQSHPWDPYRREDRARVVQRLGLSLLWCCGHLGRHSRPLFSEGGE